MQTRSDMGQSEENRHENKTKAEQANSSVVSNEMSVREQRSAGQHKHQHPRPDSGMVKAVI